MQTGFGFSHLEIESRGGVLKRVQAEEVEPKSDEQLVAQVLEGQKDLFELLVRRYEARIRGFCGQMLGTSQVVSSAEDVAQEVFVKAYQKLSTFEGRSSFSSWLYRIASNRCVDILRQRKVRRFFFLDDEEKNAVLPDELVESSTGGQIEAREILGKVLNLIPATNRSLFLLKEVQGLGISDLAKTFSLSEDSVKSRLKRVRKTLKEAINEITG